MEKKYFADKIIEALNGDVENIELVSETSNVVYRVRTKKYGDVYAKFYLNKSSHIDHEMYLYSILDSKYLKEVITSSDEPKFAIFKELKGKTLDELSLDEVAQYKNKIIESLIYFYDTVGCNKANGYGLLDENLNGKSSDFLDFIIKRQTETQDVLKDYFILNNAFSVIFEKYKELIVGDNSLVPIDTNAKNIMVCDDSEVRFIDPGELISAPKLMGYGDFAAHTYKTEFYDTLISKLNLDNDDLKRLRIYAIFSSLNILAFLKKLGVNNLEEVIPYGNHYTFLSLIIDHLEELGFEIDEKNEKIKIK